MTEPLRVALRPRKPVRVAVDVQLPFAHDEAPVRVAVAPFGAVTALCDVHDPPAQLVVPSRLLVLPAAVVVLLSDAHLPPAQVAVPVCVAPRALVDDVVRVTAIASVVAMADNAMTANSAERRRWVFMSVPLW